MARKLIVEIIGDSTGLQRSMGEAGASTSRFGNTMSKMAGVAKFAGLALVGGLAYGLDKSVKAALSTQASQAGLEAALRSTHQSVARMVPALEAAEAASRKLGFSDEDTRQALARMEIATGSTRKAIVDLAVAENLARARHMDLSNATNAMAQAMAGSQRAAKQLGIIVLPVTKNLDALKASTMNLKDAAGKAAEAHAKLLDKMATGQAVIDATKAKVEGQATAFRNSAAGGLAVFRAELEHLEVQIGTALLPALGKVVDALTKFVNWLSTSPGVAKTASAAFQVFGDVMHTLIAVGSLLLGWYEKHKTAALAILGVMAAVAIAFAGPIAIIAAVGVALIELYKRSQTFRDIVNSAFQAVRDKVNEVMPTIRAIISGVITAAEAIWERFGSTIISVTRTALETVARVFRDIGGVISGVVSLIGDIIHGRWGKIWGDLVGIVSHALDAVYAVIRGAVSIVLTAALAIGKALVDGIVSGVSNLAGSLADKVKGQIHGAIASIKGAFGIGSPSTFTAAELGQPLGEGVVMGWILGTAALPSKMKQSLQDAINAGRTVIQAARSAFTTDFSGLMSVADSALAAVQGKVQTAAEKALAALTSAHDAAQAAAQMAAAQDALAQAQAGGDPAAIVAAQQAVDDLLYQAHVAALQKKAAAERLNLDARLAIQKQNFDAALTALQDHLVKHGAATGQATETILALLRAYGVNFKAVGQDMGLAWIGGLKEAISKAAEGAGQLSSTVSDVAAGIKIPSKAHAMAAGGIVTRPTLALIGERGPEAVVPLSYRGAGAGGGSGGGLTVNFNGPVYGMNDFEQKVTKIIVKANRRGNLLATDIR